ncbi:MAG TPA: D-glycerate dehydrogenase [Candidatus Nanoarchaeia archaeon]|nr:D-glycerate dehydrogenase [Candidatus Nanoarchaeia archaeon]
MLKKRWKVFVTRNIPGSAIPLLKKHFQVKVYPRDEIIPRKKLLNGIRWCDALLCLLTDNVDKEIIDANPNLKVISNYAVGYDNIDVKHATEKLIPVCNTPSQQVVDAVAEHAFALMLAAAKRLHEDEEYVREHKWKSWAPKLLLGTQLTDKTVGIIGLGKIGSGVAKRVSCMGMKVVYYDVKRDNLFERQFKAKYLSLNNLLKQADFVTLHVPLLKSTRHLISTKQLRMMKKTAYLINTSRGPVVDEKALVKALNNGWIKGAGLDVYESEPDQNHSLHKIDNCILTPHVASATVEVREQMGIDAAENIIAIFRGKKPLKIVNPEVYS